MALNEFGRQPAQKNDEEASLLSIHGTKLRLVTAYFTREYLSHLQSNQILHWLFVWKGQVSNLSRPFIPS